MPKRADNIFYENTVAKAILFRTAEMKYGIKPNSIGDMRYITVPYAIALLGIKTDYKIDLYKIWKNQSLSENLSNQLYKIMVSIEDYIKKNAPGSLYGEWAKKDECWIEIKNAKIEVDLNLIRADFIGQHSQNRKSITDEELNQLEIVEELTRIKDIPYEIWKKIEKWGRNTNELSPYLAEIVFNVAIKIRKDSTISDIERKKAIEIIDIVIQNAPDLLFEIDEIDEKVEENNEEIIVDYDLVEKMVAWDRKNKKLMGYQFQFLWKLLQDKRPLNERDIKYVLMNLKAIERFGFKK